MIEFTPDGPFSEKADQLFPGRVRVIGVGQTGAAVCDQLVLHGRPAQDLWVFDSDQLTIEGSVVPNRHLLGHSLVHGLGCNGDIELARGMTYRVAPARLFRALTPILVTIAVTLFLAIRPAS